MVLILESYIRGLTLGSSVYGISYIMDRTIAYPSYLNVVNNTQSLSLYHEGWNRITQNLLLITPPAYTFTVNTLTVPGTLYFTSIQPINLVLFVIIHNFFYYCAHKFMHTNINFYRIHSFHHKFHDVMLPSIGNSVSKREFLFSYLTPILLATLILPITESTLVAGVFIITMGNLIIHCKELEHFTYPAYLVSPAKHITHHLKRTKHYAAPFFDFDEFLDQESYK